ncbi:hypothetical protein KFE80_00400 [bacterium SCSIO 12696]|nr:hypothetical protein KFE80_00400 [bacterium SCSIO 12696]
MIEIVKEVGLWAVLFIGAVVLIARGSQLLLMAIIGDDGFDEYICAKLYRDSGNIFIRGLGITMEYSSELMLSIIKIFPLIVAAFSSLILLWALYAIQNT